MTTLSFISWFDIANSPFSFMFEEKNLTSWPLLKNSFASSKALVQTPETPSLKLQISNIFIFLSLVTMVNHSKLSI